VRGFQTGRSHELACDHLKHRAYRADLVKNPSSNSRIKRALFTESANARVLQQFGRNRVSMMQRRRYVRTKVSKAAKIFFGHCEAIDCVVIDLSIGGAGIIAPNVAAIPDEFDLSFDSARTLRPCRTAWRSATAMGVAFI